MQRAITLASVDKGLCRHMALLGHNGLTDHDCNMFLLNAYVLLNAYILLQAIPYGIVFSAMIMDDDELLVTNRQLNR